MSSSDLISAKPSEDRPLRIRAILVIVAGIGLVVLLYFGPAGNILLPPVRADILTSIAGAILQLIVLGVVGVFVKDEFDKHQERRTHDRQDAEQRRKQAREDAESAQQKLKAKTELRQTLLRRVVTANRMVRKAWILIAAPASAKTYGENMRILVDAQLEFSDIRHEIPSLFDGNSLIEQHVETLEKYLGGLVLEYRQNYQNVVDAERIKDRKAVQAVLETLSEYQNFVTTVQGNEGNSLYTKYLPSYWNARNAMRRVILGEVPADAAAG
jgi:hypothetical protein